MSLQGVPLSSRRRRVPTEATVTLSLASAVQTATADVRPAIANALWPRLKAQAWVRAMRPTTSHSVGAGIRTTTPPVPGPKDAPRWEPVPEAECLYAVATRAQTRLGFGLSIKLYREAHDEVLRMLDWKARSEYRHALEECYCERPFYRAPELPSGWRRNHKAPLITERVASVLQQLAAAAIVERITPEVEDSLIG